MFWRLVPWPRRSGRPSLALIHHWYCTNTAGHGDSAVDHSRFRHCTGRGWVGGLKEWPSSIFTHNIPFKMLQREARIQRHTHSIKLLHQLCWMSYIYIYILTQTLMHRPVTDDGTRVFMLCVVLTCGLIFCCSQLCFETLKKKKAHTSCDNEICVTLTLEDTCENKTRLSR